MKFESYKIDVESQMTGFATLHAYLLDNISVAKDKKRPAVIVCPGGGYRQCSDREGEPVVMQFLAMGYHSFLLDYSVEPNIFPTALLELAKAVAFVREHSAEWNIDPEKVILCGFSAGGHLCCSLGVYWDKEFVYNAIHKSKEDVRPNGMILGYPVITAGPYAHKPSIQRLLGTCTTEQPPVFPSHLSLELQVTDQTPKSFIWHTFTDQSVSLENSLLLITALRKHGVEFEYHVFPVGAHGASLANEETSGCHKHHILPRLQSWIKLAGTWIENL